MIANPVDPCCTKNIETDIHFVHEKVALGKSVSMSRHLISMRTSWPKAYLFMTLGPVFVFVVPPLW